MRMWMVDPSKMCRKHLLGEHVELHMFVAHLNKGKSVRGYLENNCLQPVSIATRHEVLVLEMVRRGYNHKSPLPPLNKEVSDNVWFAWLIDRESALKDLHNRCPLCKAGGLDYILNVRKEEL